MQRCDTKGRGLKCGHILHTKTLGYSDDVVLVTETVEELTDRFSRITDASLVEADMQVNMDKTLSQHVHAREEIDVTEAEVAKAEAKYEHKCDFCPRRFKTKRGMLIHRARCMHNYDTTDEVYYLEK